MITEGTLLESESGNRFKVIRIWDKFRIDIKALQPLMEWLPDYYPIYYSVDWRDFKIINEGILESDEGANAINP